MLQILGISKQYRTGELIQRALDSVSLALRDSEFVAILGPSGSGKTTLLNIIGGLDQYDSGDLIISGTSTKNYGSREWDSYRNHSIGFVFQSYNLIPHQSVLANVELALTIGGLKKSQRRERAQAALEAVGLGDQGHKKPNQLSGGQMQRVAIARALVNDPEIVLADEPTGALDTETSLQVMDLLAEVAKDRLVVMVTHNPELASRYASRIVKLRDGKIISDSMPFNPSISIATPPARKRGRHAAKPVTAAKEAPHEPEPSILPAGAEASAAPPASPHKGETAAAPVQKRRAKMRFATSLALSFNNLRTKKARTILTAFAGSIGIIGIALILALSNGINSYIMDTQRETMSSYPLQINAQTLDLSVMQQTRDTVIDAEQAADRKQSGQIFSDPTSLQARQAFQNSVTTNDLTAFKKYLDDPSSEIHQYVGENGITYAYATKMYAYTMNAEGTFVDTDSGSKPAPSQQATAAEPVAQPEQGAGFPSALGGAGQASGDGAPGATPAGGTDFNPLQLLLGRTESETATNFSQVTPKPDGTGVNAAVTAAYDLVAGDWAGSADEVMLVLSANNGVDTKSLFNLGLISADDYNATVDAVTAKDTPPEVKLDFAAALGHEYFLLPAALTYSEEEANAAGDGASDGEAAANDSDAAAASSNASFFRDESGSVTAEKAEQEGFKVHIAGVIRLKDPENAAQLSTPIVYTQQLTDELIAATDASAVVQAQEAAPELDVLSGRTFADEKQQAADQGLPADSVPTAESNLKAFGKVSYDAPSSISIYVDSFEAKESVADAIAAYNEASPEEQRITYTDLIALLTSSITAIINAISYVLIAFVAVSLIVSCIMIGIITHISVLERTKEIGILRALGASKRNIAQVFNAETVIIGLFAGLLGVAISVALTFPINALIRKLAGDLEISATVPPLAAVVLVAISVVVTVLGGVLPARSAAKKDPVLALRAE